MFINHLISWKGVNSVYGCNSCPVELLTILQAERDFLEEQKCKYARASSKDAGNQVAKKLIGVKRPLSEDDDSSDLELDRDVTSPKSAQMSKQPKVEESKPQNEGGTPHQAVIQEAADSQSESDEDDVPLSMKLKQLASP